MNYYIADLHFGCQNKYEGRTLEHDQLIIDNWNRIVTNADTVYILGDIGRVGSNKDNEYLCKCISVLKGAVLLYGHLHTTDEWEMYKRCLKDVNDFFEYKTLKGSTDCPPAMAYNCGCMLDYMNYTPRTLKEIISANSEKSS